MKEPYLISYQEHASPEEEGALLEGVIQAAVAAKQMSRIQSFSFFIKDSAKTIL